MSGMRLQWLHADRGSETANGGRCRRVGDGHVDWIAHLRSLPLFEDLGDEVLRLLDAESCHRVFRMGETIFYQGDPGLTCQVILRGRVRVLVVGEDGSELAMRILVPGEIVGEMALFEELPRSATVETLEETHTLELHQDTLLCSLQRSPGLALSLLRALSARLRYATEEAEELASLTVAERLMRRLGRLAEWTGVPVSGGVRIALPMTQQELAALVGTSRESVNRALVRLRREGKVRLDDGWVVLLDGESERGVV
jgi:CRP/FNR family cyclic AMP-dependent transcriptional regulator